jgi:uncharacterized RDD family membrane protein YckC
MTATDVHDPTAVMGRRIVAHLIDSVIYIGAFVGAFAAFAQEGGSRAATRDRFRVDWVDDRVFVELGDRLYFLESQDFWIAIAIGLGVSLFFMVVLDGLRGVTLGKSLTGIRTVNAEGEPPGLLRALGRTVLWVVDEFPTGFVLPLVGGVTAFSSTGHRRVGDMVGGTYVIKRAYVSQPVTPAGAVAPTSAARSWEPAADTWAPSPGATERAPTYQPQWDPARKAYLQWDPRHQHWLQFDDTTQEWRPIS